MRTLLIFFLLFISSGVLAENNQFTRISTYNVSSINPTPETNLPGAMFPGNRGANQLIIYTPAFGNYTGTNEFGREATVIDGQVFSFNGANSYIPPNGFVISGHGNAKTWINQNIIEGAFVKLDPTTNAVQSIITPESYLYQAEHKLSQVQKVILQYKKTLLNYQYKTAQKYYSDGIEKLQEAKYLIARGDYQNAMSDLNTSLVFSKKAYYYAIPALRNELHGIWLRPTEKNNAEIVKTLEKLQRAGIDNIFLETYYQGYTIFPSKTMAKYGITAQRREFQGWDPLAEWIKEAHARSMKVHVWFQTFYAGNDKVTTTPGHILFVYPEWANVQRRNALEDVPMPSNSEHNGYFLDPANHLVQRFLLSLITEISSDYEIDGINIDYIRYPKSLTPDIPGYIDSTWGYSAYARDEFKKLYNIDPYCITETHELWPQWIKYREDKVTSFVSQLRQAVAVRKPLISAVIFPGIDETASTKLQNWPEWAQNRYIDAFTPLIMSSDELRAEKSVYEVSELSGGNVKVYAGLFEPFTAGSPENLLSEIVAARKAGASGIVIFDNAHLDEGFIEALNTRIFRN